MRSTTRLLAAAAGALVAAGLLSAPAAATPQKQDVLREYAADTWRSFTAMVDPDTGLVSENIGGNLDPADRSAFTSPTNIGAYLWSTIVAWKLKFISADEAQARISQTLATLATLEIHEPSGMYYNWYNPSTGEKLTTWPVDGSTVYPFVSSVDNGWLATALVIVKDLVPQLAAPADSILGRMDFGYYYNPAENQIRGGFWVDPPPGCYVAGNYRGGAPVYYTCHHYGAFNTEPRMASYLGIASGQIPQRHYFGMWRTFPPTCDWSWTEQQPTGEWRSYLGVDVFEGVYSYRGMQMVPTWGGSMFEALMVPLFVPEEQWGTRSWALNHPVYVQAQIEHGLVEAGYGYWGFSPSNNPSGGYREYGVDPIGMEPNGYTSDQERTLVDYGYDACPGREQPVIPTDYGQGVVTPHASFLALRFAEDEALANLANLRADFDAYGPGGFYDAVNVVTGEVSQRHLALDQGMIMAALGDELLNDLLRKPFDKGGMKQEVAPLMRMEEFSLPSGVGR